MDEITSSTLKTLNSPANYIYISVTLKSTEKRESKCLILFNKEIDNSFVAKITH